MTQYWWVNQTRQYKDERDQGLVAGEIKEKPGKTHWGRENVKNMKKGDHIVCYRSGVGIDQLARVTKDGERGNAPWKTANDKTRAFRANVEYFPITPIPKKEFVQKIQKNSNDKNSPIKSDSNVKFAYAIEFTKVGFDTIANIAMKSNPDSGLENWLQNLEDID
jgi:hypothetical protein